MSGSRAALDARWALGHALVGTLLAAWLGLALAGDLSAGEKPESTADPDDNWPCVFRHLCENPRLTSILVRRQLLKPTGTDAQSLPGHLCILGPFLFTQASLYFELYPKEGVDELWIVRAESTAADPPPVLPLAQLKLTQAAVEFRRFADGTVIRHASLNERELPAVLDVRADSVRIGPRQSVYFQDVRSHFTPMSVPAAGGCFIGIPCVPDSLPGCGFAALFVKLPPAEAKRWRATVGSESR
jgi:hypothetical protein